MARSPSNRRWHGRALPALEAAASGAGQWWSAKASRSAPAPAYTCAIAAFDAQNGKSIWSTETAKKQSWPATQVSIAGGLWKVPGFDAPQILATGPAVTATRVHYLEDSCVLACIDRASGKKLWKATTKESLFQHGIAVAGGTVVVKDDAGRLHAFDEASGKKRWTSDADLDEPYGIGPHHPDHRRRHRRLRHGRRHVVRQ